MYINTASGKERDAKPRTIIALTDPHFTTHRRQDLRPLRVILWQLHSKRNTRTGQAFSHHSPDLLQRCIGLDVHYDLLLLRLRPLVNQQKFSKPSAGRFAPPVCCVIGRGTRATHAAGSGRGLATKTSEIKTALPTTARIQEYDGRSWLLNLLIHFTAAIASRRKPISVTSAV
jgi:hypothetical protein